MLLLLLVTVLFANKHKNILWNPEWARQRGLLFHVWAGTLPIEIRLAFELQEAGGGLHAEAADPKGWAVSCSFHLGVVGRPSLRLCAAGVTALTGHCGGGGQGTLQDGGLSTKGGKQPLESELLEDEPHLGALGWRKPSRFCRIYLLSGPNYRKIVGSTFKDFFFPTRINYSRDKAGLAVSAGDSLG